MKTDSLVCDGCGGIKEIVLFELGVRRFCSSCKIFLWKKEKEAIKILNKKNKYKPKSGVLRP